MTLTNEEAIIEQLALGNKATSIRYQVTVDLSKRQRTEAIRAEFPDLKLVNESAGNYESEAREWLGMWKKTQGSIIIIGRQGQVATVPYSRKDNDLQRIINEMNK